MGRIRILDDLLVDKIAAGEVVERPASVVKELVENALDAGARTVRIELEDGGKKRITVIDDGSGMEKEDVALAVRRHATSKISAADDLFNVATLGFRGEALPSIAAVSRLTILTRRDSDATGTKLSAVGGEQVVMEPWSGPPGTRVTVADLFFDVPARAKFLKATATELAQCLDLVQALALARPDVGFVVATTQRGHDREHFNFIAPATSSQATPNKPMLPTEPLLRRRAAEVLGEKTAAALLFVDRDSRFGRLTALLSPPGVEKGSAKLMFTFVNGRVVRDKALRYGFLRGYASHLMTGRYPIVVAHYQVDPGLVDVNVHPAKTELRFQYQSEMQASLALAVREALRSAAWVRPDDGKGGDLAASAFSFASGTRPTASRTDEGRTRVGASSGFAGAPPSEPSREHQELGMRGERRAPARSIEASDARFDPRYDNRFGSERSLDFFAPRPALTRLSSPFTASPSRVSSPLGSLCNAYGESALERDLLLSSRGANAAASDASTSEADTNEENAGEVIPWPELRYVGAFARCYLFFEWHDRLLVLDQHAFHERILFEKLMRDDALLGRSQPLLMAEAVALTPGEAASLADQIDDLKRLGFDLDIEGDAVTVRAVPALLAGRDLQALIEEIASREEQDRPAGLAQGLLATLACHGAVRSGEELGESELRQLLNEASEVDFYHNCPHGRRVFRWWLRRDIAGWFDR